MKILLLAPHPFFQERGTPIAVNLLLKVLSAGGHSVDVLTYHIGDNVSHPNVTIHRIRNLGFIKTIRPGFSVKKIVCDLYMLPKALAMARRGGYDLVHAVEESVFIARIIRRLYGIPFIYDMDSSLPAQMVEKMPLLVVLRPIMRWFERRAIRRAAAVVAVCDSLAIIAREAGSQRVVVLNDISLMEPAHEGARGDTRRKLDIKDTCFMYVGNLERYQGIDLLLDSFAILLRSSPDCTLVIAGGTESGISDYRKRADTLGIGRSVRFTGPWPLKEMSTLFAAADILVSPRLTGNNTPMKIYSYLDSGKPVLATDMPAHTQVLDHETSLLAPTLPAEFAAAMIRLANDPVLRDDIGRRGKELAARKYSLNAFRATITELYSKLEKALPETQERAGRSQRGT